jgi:predicted Zn finger-like uncharacterized protein
MAAMIVQCPSCKTTYRVADEVVKGAAPVFRCSRCKHAFELQSAKVQGKPDEKAPVSETAFVKAEKEAELSFAFAPKKQASTDPKAVVDPWTQDDEPSTSNANTEPLSSTRNVDPGKADEPRMVAEPVGAVENDEAIHRLTHLQPQHAPAQSLPQAREMTDNVLALDTRRDQPASTLPYLTLFGFLVILFGFATAFHLSHPDVSEGLVRTIPLLGTSLLKNSHLKNRVAVGSLHASYQTIQGNREVFVITGDVENQNPVVIREVRVAGQIYNLEGREIEQQTIWIGNALSPRIIRGMTVQDISDLQRLKPLKTFEIPPGDSIPFTIVFLKSTKGIKDFSCEVLAAESGA